VPPLVHWILGCAALLGVVGVALLAMATVSALRSNWNR
jgi:hypothetical protein